MALVVEIASSAGRPLSVQALCFVVTATKEWLAAGGRMTLDEAWGINPKKRGEKSLPRKLLTARRASALLDAFRAIGEPHLSVWRRCDLLAAEIADFKVRFWPAWQSTGPIEGASELRRALCRVFVEYAETERAPPDTAEKIYGSLRTII